MRAVVGGMLVLLLLSAAQAAEDPLSANWVLEGCRQALLPEQRQNDGGLFFKEGVCSGQVNALYYILGVNRDFAKKNPSAGAVCADIPNGASAAELMRVVIAFVEKHPNRMHEGFSRLATQAMTEAWPCR